MAGPAHCPPRHARLARHTAMVMLTTRFVEAAVVKPITLKIYTQTIRSMHDYFGADVPLAGITAEQGDCWR